jgi:hypothetical protein
VSVLDEIIDGATGDSVSTANLLRKVQVASTRLGAREIVDWTKRELNGYKSDDALPSYRAAAPAAVQGVFTGPFQSVVRHDLQKPLTGDWDDAFQVTYRMPLAELEAFAASDEDPAIEWPPFLVKAYEKTGTMAVHMHVLFSAHVTIPRQRLHGVIDSIRTAALEFALELQQANPDAGTSGGPTVGSDAEVASVVNNVTNNIYGHGANIATGSSITQTSNVAVGDFKALVEAAEKAGLGGTDALAFADAVREEAGVDGPKVKNFLERLQAGAVKLVGDVGVKVTAAELTTLALHFIGTLH